MIVGPANFEPGEPAGSDRLGHQCPTINLRSASTVVVTPDGETVVIGGLMETDKATVDTKIPILGDIPGTGCAFPAPQKVNVKTELLIFLTPHVVQMPSSWPAPPRMEDRQVGTCPQSLQRAGV